MRVIFLAERRCALSANGIYLGTIDGFERSTELDPADGVFFEASAPGFAAVRFRFDEALLFGPPPQISLYFTGEGVAVYLSDFVLDDPSMRVTAQARLSAALLTLFVQGRVQLSLENETGFHLVPLPFGLEHASLTEAGGGYLVEGEEMFCLLSREGEVVALAEGTVLERGETLRAETKFRDSLAHTALCAWREGKLAECSIRTARPPTPATYALALFESARIGADCLPYLAPALAPKAGALREFLGDFRDVALTAREDEIGLVYERKPRVYDVRVFRVELEDGKVSNIFSPEQT